MRRKCLSRSVLCSTLRRRAHFGSFPITGSACRPTKPNPENAVRDLVSFLPVLAYDGANMTQIDAGGILDIALAGTSATLLARKWESALLVNVDNDTLRRIMNNEEAMRAVEQIEGWRSLGDNAIETIINKSENVKELKAKAKSGEISNGRREYSPPRRRSSGRSGKRFRRNWSSLLLGYRPSCI